MSTKTKARRFQSLNIDQCFANVNSAMERRHECYMDAARYMYSAFVQFTEVDGHKPCHFWAMATKETGLTKGFCEGLIAAHKNFAGLAPDAGRNIEDKAYHYSRNVSSTVIKKMAATARRGKNVSRWDVYSWHCEDCGLPITRQGYTITLGKGKSKMRFTYTTTANLTETQVLKRLCKAYESGVQVEMNVRGRKAA